MTSLLQRYDILENLTINILREKVPFLKESKEGEGLEQRCTSSQTQSLKSRGLHLEEGNVIVDSAKEDASSTSSRDETTATTNSDAL